MKLAWSVMMAHVPVHPLDQRRADELRAEPLSYRPPDGPEGATLSGYHHLSHATILRRRDFDGAARDLLEWRMHSRAGLRVHASDIPLRQDSVVLMRLGPGMVSLKIPCRVVEVVDERRRRGFAYGTLPGHPEAGEERFLLEHLDDGRIRFTITGYSRPASTLARLGGPLSRAAQRVMIRRYLNALDRL